MEFIYTLRLADNFMVYIFIGLHY